MLPGFDVIPNLSIKGLRKPSTSEKTLNARFSYGWQSRASLGLDWVKSSLPLTQRLTLWLNSWICICSRLSCCSELPAQLSWPSPGSTTSPSGNSAALSLPPWQVTFLGVGLTRLAVLPNLIPAFPHTLLCRAVSPTAPCVPSWLLELSGNFQGNFQHLKAADLSRELTIISCLCCGNTRSSEGFIFYLVSALWSYSLFTVQSASLFHFTPVDERSAWIRFVLAVKSHFSIV